MPWASQFRHRTALCGRTQARGTSYSSILFRLTGLIAAMAGGRDPDRIRRGLPISEFFQAELQEIVTRGYTRIVPGAWPVVP